jgi:hypothetical protein
MECNHQPLYAKDMCKTCYYKKWYQDNKLKEKKRGAKYYASHKKKRAKQRRIWNRDNKHKLTAYYRDKFKNDLQFRLKKTLRARLYAAVKHKLKSGSAVKDLGCSIEDFILYLESKFHPNPLTQELMTWNNYGQWQLDHVIELNNFDLSKREDIIKAVHYTNIQPLWTEEHVIKTAEYLKNKISYK